jgi:hypothetical protein
MTNMMTLKKAAIGAAATCLAALTLGSAAQAATFEFGTIGPGYTFYGSNYSTPKTSYTFDFTSTAAYTLTFDGSVFTGGPSTVSDTFSVPKLTLASYSLITSPAPELGR